MDRLLLLSLPESAQTAPSNLNNLKSDSGEISHGMAGSTETGDEDLVVLVDERHTTILGDVGSDSLVVFTELHTDALTHGRVRLLGLNTDLLNNDTSGVRSTGKGFLPFGVLMSLLVAEISPSNHKIGGLVR